MSAAAPIVVVSKPLPPGELRRFIGNPFPDMVKFVVDIERKLVAIGGELHSDAEDVLIERGSRQESLWGGNYYPGRGEARCLEYGSMINIRSAQKNESMLVQDPAIREKIRTVVFSLIGRGEPLG
jgi:hypothetical protein